MIHKPSLALISIFFRDRTTLRFLTGVLAGLSFSIAVILGTIGIMDGFEGAIKQALRKASGDYTIHSYDGFFRFEAILKGRLDSLGVDDYAPFVQTEAFLIYNESSKGVMAKGIDDSFVKNVGFDFSVKDDQIVLGKELMDQLGIKVGDEVTLAFAGGNRTSSYLPMLNRFKVISSVTHNIYRKDMRLVYLSKKTMQEFLGLKDLINYVSINLPRGFSQDISDIASTRYIEKIKEYHRQIEDQLGPSYTVRPFWEEYAPLIEAVKVEKFIISLILQLVVIISIFNVLAFIIFLSEKKAKEIFLFQAVGMNKQQFVSIWMLIIMGLWLCSCFISMGLTQILDYLLQNISLFKMPGEIYNLGRLSLRLGYQSYFFVFSLAFVWILLMTWVVLIKLKKRPILYGLRKEFS